MKIFVGQIYIEPGIKFYFSHHFQILIHSELTRLAEPSTLFIKKYAEDFNLMFNMSAKPNLIEPEIKGPGVYKKTKDVEFAIFLPHEGVPVKDKEGHRRPLVLLLQSIVKVLHKLEIDTTQIEQHSSALIDRIISDADGNMFQF